MSKAYDRIEWDFLDEVLKKFGFAVDWCNRVMDCVRSVTFSVLINGRPSEEFSPNRGLRQGDPLSPYLFILCAEVFSHLLRKAEENNSLREAIQEALRVYELSSGQKVNFDKTTLSFSKGVRDSRRGEIEQKLGVRVVEVHDRYLGLPTTVGRSKKVITKGVKEKLWKKLQGWKGMILSKAGREVMIKAVAQSLPTYAMSVFKFPSSFCDEIRSLIAQFWWGQKNGERKIHWVAWKKLCKSKGEGGLGFRDMKLFNWALLGKQAWRLATHKGSLIEQVLKAKYYPHSSFMDAELGSNPSYTWRGIWEARWVLRRGVRWRVGDGEKIRVWHDEWIPGTQSRKIISPRGNSNPNTMVGDLIHPIYKNWNRSLLSQLFLPFEVERVMSIPISSRLPEDVMCWDLEKDGVYSEVWRLSDFDIRERDVGRYVGDWWEGCFEKSEGEAMCELVTLSWALWGARCKMLMEGEGGYPMATWQYAQKICKEALEISQTRHKGGAAAAPHATEWAKPSAGTVKLNIDAGQIGVGGCGLGAVFRDEKGDVLAAGAFQFEVAWEPRVAEAKAIYHGLKLAKELGYRHLEVESDSLLAIQALRKGRGGSSEFHLIIDDILDLVVCFDFVVWSFVKRSGNNVAHMLAHLQLGRLANVLGG
ncbi:uncharacterized protein LOC130591453 [Beta vulgaris subsp. vulgaris]|uniref:uncharacterized protein LOC130591453 n=1 Tax=Beta vulgaris subsp. vulgaris TaxID=3555 RepID=UPI0025497E79|nr:uncharacterized protein LOC130591453 [Beta vulgaris subsp. vulgaris]